MREADYRGERFKDFKETDDVTNVPISLKGNDDLLALTKPVLVGKIHKEYFEAGSDICETNTVNGTTISQAEYKMPWVSYELNKMAAKLAKQAASEVTKAQPHKPRFVAGAIGPTHRMLPSREEDKAFCNVEWDELVASYEMQVKGLVDGGCDLLKIEAIFGTHNHKAAIVAVDNHFERMVYRQV